MTIDMNSLLKSIFELVEQVSPKKLEQVADHIVLLESNSNIKSTDFFSTPAAGRLFDKVINEWRSSDISAQELAGMIRGASHALNMAKNEVSTELIWTGPTTPIVSTRRTEQALIEVIDSSASNLFVVSFVAYEIPLFASAIENAIKRGVTVSLLLESSDKHGGSVTMDVIGKMKQALPRVNLYCWESKDTEFEGAKVHAKVAVADRKKCFISSANLTGHAMNKNMEAGVIITGGHVPDNLHRHLDALVTTGVIEKTT